VSSSGLLRWVLIPSAGIAFALGAAWAVSGSLAKQPPILSAPVDSADMVSLAPDGEVINGADAQADLLALRMATDGATKADRRAKPTLKIETAARFDLVAKKAALSPQKLASLFAKPEKRVAKLARAKPATLRDPAPERFAAPKDQNVPFALAYADPSPTAPAGALAALSVAAPTDDEDVLSLNAPLATEDADGHEETPDSVPLPGRRPTFEAPTKPGARAVEVQKPDQQDKDDDKPASRDAEPKKKIAYAKPDASVEEKPRGGSLFSGWFNGNNPTKARGGVAVYDISAAKVYMPDGSVLEAHSGIGEMADNPRYVQHKMRGPTPPHVYNLRMRESRFHGVEAIRMLPVDGKNKYGRTGLLTHSYLLRSGKAESHGCVAFKDYNKFLTAFKKGKIKQLVVVPGGGKAAGLRMASNGRGA
jgi:hypothetical protein